eukprot:scaffold162053_cov13-Tisochrysis_lutea.AAC.1
MGLIARKSKLENIYQSKKGKDSFSRTLSTHIDNALKEWAHAFQEGMASPLNTHYLHYWSSTLV